MGERLLFLHPNLKACKLIYIDILFFHPEEHIPLFYLYLAQILHILPNAQIVSKIESLKGMAFISQYNVPNLMAARDDLYLQSGQNYSMLNHLKTIIERDSGAICASKIFLSLEKRETVDFADFADLELMYNMGYRKFMLCDNVCNYSFAKAIQAWEEFING